MMKTMVMTTMTATNTNHNQASNNSLSHLFDDSIDDIGIYDINALEDSSEIPSDSFLSVSNRTSLGLSTNKLDIDRSTRSSNNSIELRNSYNNNVIVEGNSFSVSNTTTTNANNDDDLLLRGVCHLDSSELILRGIRRSVSNDDQWLTSGGGSSALCDSSLITPITNKSMALSLDANDLLSVASSTSSSSTTSSRSTSSNHDVSIVNSNNTTNNKDNQLHIETTDRRTSGGVTDRYYGDNSMIKSNHTSHYSRRSSHSSSYHDSCDSIMSRSIYINYHNSGAIDITETSCNSIDLFDDEDASESHVECVTDFDNDMKSSIQKLVDTNSIKLMTVVSLHQQLNKATPNDSTRLPKGSHNNKNIKNTSLSNYLPGGYSSMSTIQIPQLRISSSSTSYSTSSTNNVDNDNNNCSSLLSSLSHTSLNQHNNNQTNSTIMKKMKYQRRNSVDNSCAHVSTFRKEKQQKLENLLIKATELVDHIKKIEMTGDTNQSTTETKTVDNNNNNNGISKRGRRRQSNTPPATTGTGWSIDNETLSLQGNNDRFASVSLSPPKYSRSSQHQRRASQTPPPTDLYHLNNESNNSNSNYYAMNTLTCYGINDSFTSLSLSMTSTSNTSVDIVIEGSCSGTSTINSDSNHGLKAIVNPSSLTMRQSLHTQRTDFAPKVPSRSRSPVRTLTMYFLK